VKTKTLSASLVMLAVSLLVLTACGGGATAAKDLPVYTGAVELKPGESTVGDTLAKNMQQDTALRQAIGAGGKTEQKGFKLPADTTWDQVNAFYDKELKAAGWSSGLGGIAGSFVDLNAVMNTANEDNGLFKIAIWSKDKQTLSVVMTKSPTDPSDEELLLSLSTQ
jgi:hypothetical protein